MGRREGGIEGGWEGGREVGGHYSVEWTGNSYFCDLTGQSM